MALRDLKTLNRRKYQHAMNRLVRKFNKSIQEDWLWNARFVMRQKAFYCRPYDDHSGMECDFTLELKDTKTGKVETKHVDQYDASYKIWEWGNYCITETWKVWQEDPNPNEQARIEGRQPPKLW